MRLTAILLLLVAAQIGSVHAQATEPDKRPVTLIVPYPAGGPSDVGARRLVPDLERELGQTVVVENVAGATGAIGTQRLTQSDPDGLTLMYGSPNELILVPATNPAVKYRSTDVVNVGLVTTTPLVLVTHGGSPFKSADEMVAWLRTDPKRELTYGSVGIGSMQHLAAARLATLSNLRMLHVPYKGAAPMLTDLMGQQIDVSVMTLTGGTLGHIQSGKLRSLGVLSTKRTPLAEELSTINESKSFRSVEFTLWGGLFVTSRTPIAIQQRLNDAINRVVGQTAIRAQIQASGGQPAGAMTLEQLNARYVRETSQYEEIAKALNIRVD